MKYEAWDEWEIRRQICEAGQRLYDLFFVAGNDGNISVRLNDDEILVTPTNISKGHMRPEQMVTMAPDGSVLPCGPDVKPSSEYRMHLTIYEHRPDIRAVVHAHPPTATGFAVANVGLDKPFLPEVVVRTGPTALVPYAIPGGHELPASLTPFLRDHQSLLLGNHGVLTYAPTLIEALFAMETVELNARIYLSAYQLGGIKYLDDEQVAALRARYGG